MAQSISPSGYNNFEDDPIYQNANYTHDISEQMRVPKNIRIKSTGEYFDDLDLRSNNGQMNYYDRFDDHKYDMTVPDRIVVIGQDQHLVISGTKSAPREIILENSMLPKEPGIVRVSTPPRVISLSHHHFPSASETSQNDEANEQSRSLEVFEDRRELHNASNGIDGDGRGVITSKSRNYRNNNTSDLVFGRREETPPLNSSIENLSQTEEMVHLRKQVAKLNRRVISIEIDNVQRQQREKIIYCVGLAYFLLKAFMWLNRK